MEISGAKDKANIISLISLSAYCFIDGAFGSCKPFTHGKHFFERSEAGVQRLWKKGNKRGSRGE